MYNGITREVERELLPALKTLGMRFYAYNPLVSDTDRGRRLQWGGVRVNSGRKMYCLFYAVSVRFKHRKTRERRFLSRKIHICRELEKKLTFMDTHFVRGEIARREIEHLHIYGEVWCVSKSCATLDHLHDSSSGHSTLKLPQCKKCRPVTAIKLLWCTHANIPLIG